MERKTAFLVWPLPDGKTSVANRRIIDFDAKRGFQDRSSKEAARGYAP